MLTTQQTDLNALFSGNEATIRTELQRYGEAITVDGTLSLNNIANDFQRRMFLHQIVAQYKKQNISAPNKDLMSFLRYFGLVSVQSTQSLKMVYSIEEKKKRYITNATVTTTGTPGGAVSIALPAEFSLASGMVVDLNDILEIGETRFQVRVIGLDNGSGDGLSKLGVKANGTAMTGGGASGTDTANVIIALPVTQEAVPAFTTDEKLFFVGNQKEEMSCPDNPIMDTFPNLYETGFTIVDEHAKYSGTAMSTQVNGVAVTNANGRELVAGASCAGKVLRRTTKRRSNSRKSTLFSEDRKRPFATWKARVSKRWRGS